MKTAEFQILIDQTDKEEPIQKFLENNSGFIPHEFIQNHGLHLNMVYKKLPLGGEYCSDFAYLSKSSGDWNFILVELEKPGTKYFKNNSTDFHSDFIKGLDQIDKWRAWLKNQKNSEYLVQSVMRPMVDSPMKANPVHFKYVLVTGRRSEFEANSQRRDLVTAKEREDFKILSYDSLMDGYSKNKTAYVCSLKNTHVSVHSKNFSGDSLFAWIPSENLRITESLKQDCYANQESWVSSDLQGKEIGSKLMDRLLPTLKIVSENEE